MKNHLWILISIILPFTGFAQKLSKEEKEQKSICEKYSKTVANDFGDGTVTTTKPIRVGPFIQLSTIRTGKERKLILELSFFKETSPVLGTDDIHEFSLYNSEGKIVVKMSPAYEASPEIKTTYREAQGAISGRFITTCNYKLTYILTDEMFEHFSNYNLKAIRISSISADEPFKVDNESRADLFRGMVRCLGQ